MATDNTTPQKKRFQLFSPDSSPLFISTAPKSCIFCLSNAEDEVRLGELLSSEDVSVHYNCLLSASILAQKVGDDEGIRGFTVPSIKYAARNARKEPCAYCDNLGAVVGCCQKKCNNFFHFPCGQKNGCLTLFYGTFNSYCNEHSEKNVIPDCDKKSSCPVCTEDFEDSDILFKSDCCRYVSHLDCIRVYAYNAGTYVLKCPFCFDEEAFVSNVMKFSGIYIPTREPTYEDHDRMTMELDCCAEHCPEPERCENNDIWSLIKCTMCGSRAMHVCCVKALPNGHFVCPDCGDDDSWQDEYRVKLSVRGNSGRAFKFQLSSLTTKLVAISVKDPSKLTVTKSGRCSKRYESKLKHSDQPVEETVKLQSSKSRKYSDSEDDDDDDDNENSENAGRKSNTPKRKRSRGPNKIQAKKPKTDAENCLQNNENPLSNITNTDNIPNDNANNTGNADNLVSDQKVAIKPKKPRKKYPLAGKTKKCFILNMMQGTNEHTQQNKENMVDQPSGFFEPEAETFGQIIRPCEIVEVLKEECELDPTIPTRSVNCLVCNSTPKFGKLPPSIPVPKKGKGKMKDSENVLSYTKVTANGWSF